MNEKLNDDLIDLLTSKASFGIDPAEKAELDKMLSEMGLEDDGSFDMAAAAIGLVDIDVSEPLPQHLHARILASGDEFISSLGQSAVKSEQASAAASDDLQKTFTFEPRRRSWSWLGWAVAAAACIALAFNIWSTRIERPPVAGLTTPSPTPAKLTPEQEMAALMSSPDVIKASWGEGNVKDLKDLGGDVVWSDEKQKGFMRLRGLPANDKTKEQYQLWIFDKTQDPKKPIDGGVFDVPTNGEVIIPIDAKLRALGPSMFAITVEKPGGVVVSDRQKIAALAKVETQTKAAS